MRRFVIFTAIIGAIVVLAFVAKGSGGDVVKVRMEPVMRGQVARTVLASGMVNYRENINLRTEVTGRIVHISVEEGDRVKAGDTLLVIGPELFEAEVEQRKALVNMRSIAIERQAVYLAQMRRKLDRQKDLFDRGNVSKDSYEIIERDVALAELDLKTRRQELIQAKASHSSALDRLRKTVIKAPIDGIITALNAKVGETVVAGTTNIIGSSLMDISDPSAIIAEVKVDEADILSVAPGQMAGVFIAPAPDDRLMGEVISIGTTARSDENKVNSFLVKILLSDKGEGFSRLAISCRADILTDVVEDTVLVPVEALLYEEADDGTETPYVFVEMGGEAVRKDLKVGIQTDTSVEVLSGVAEGDILVVGPYRKLKNLKEGKLLEAESEEKGE